MATAKKKITVDLDIELYEKFQAMLKAEDIPVAQQVRKFIRQYVGVKEKDKVNSASIFNLDFENGK